MLPNIPFTFQWPQIMVALSLINISWFISLALIKKKIKTIFLLSCEKESVWAIQSHHSYNLGKHWASVLQSKTRLVKTSF
jgi:hypothetical protein